MKKRIRKTGEIVDVIDYGLLDVDSNYTKRNKKDYVSYIDNHGEEHIKVKGLNIKFDFEDVEDKVDVEGKLTKEIDWEEVRIKAAIATLQGLASNSHNQMVDTPVHTLSKWSVQAADALIAELKEGGTK